MKSDKELKEIGTNRRYSELTTEEKLRLIDLLIEEEDEVK